VILRLLHGALPHPHPCGTLPPSECCTIQSSGLVTISFRLSLRCALGAF